MLVNGIIWEIHLKRRWHWRISGSLWKSVCTLEEDRMGGLLSSRGFL